MSLKITLKTILLTCISVFLSMQVISQDSCMECPGNTASGDKSTAIGLGSEALGVYSFSSGYHNIASGNASIAMGYESNADGHYSLAIGRNCYAKPRSIALGDFSLAVGEPSISIGHHVETAAARTITIGFSESDKTLINNISSSLMIGFRSDEPTLFVGPTQYGDNFGKVGIGTTNPLTTLDVNGGVKCNEFAMPNENAEEGYVLTCDELGYADWAPGSQSLWTRSTTIENAIYRAEGNVGIGTNSPYAKLQIGNLWTFTLGPDNKKQIGYNTTWNANQYFRISQGPGAMLTFESSGAISIQNIPYGAAGEPVEPLESVIFDNRGFVGIGTRTPETMLDVNGRIKTNEFQLVSGLFDNGYVLRCNYDGSAYWANPDELSDGDWEINDNIIWAEENKSIGIGTSNPTESLHLKENMMINGHIMGGRDNYEGFHIYAGSNTGNGAYMTMASNYDNTGSIKMYSKGSSARIEFHNDNGQIMSVRANNDVVLGSPDLTVNQYVNGYIEAHKVRVSTDTWWDKVLKPGYELRSLDRLEYYINNNYHLPDIPTEDEIKENGLDVGEMNALLLKKIEELTLYTIQQQKEIEVLKKCIEKLSN